MVTQVGVQSAEVVVPGARLLRSLRDRWLERSRTAATRRVLADLDGHLRQDIGAGLGTDRVNLDNLCLY